MHAASLSPKSEPALGSHRTLARGPGKPLRLSEAASSPVHAVVVLALLVSGGSGETSGCCEKSQVLGSGGVSCFHEPSPQVARPQALPLPPC